MDKLKTRQLKVHIIFGGALALVIVFGVISRMSAGERLMPALWNSLKDIRPFEWLMIVLLWYSTAFPKPAREWPLTTLGLSPRK